MGLDLFSEHKEDRFGSYSRLHRLKKWLLIHAEGNSQRTVEDAYNPMDGNWDKLKIQKFPEIINHSDCDGCYIDLSYYGINSVKDTGFCGDINKLALELLKAQKEYRGKMPQDIVDIFVDFCSYVFYQSMPDALETWEKYHDLKEIEIAQYLKFC